MQVLPNDVRNLHHFLNETGKIFENRSRFQTAGINWIRFWTNWAVRIGLVKG